MRIDPDTIPRDVSVRCWTLRDDNHGHYHGIVDLSESPLYLDLRWRLNRGAPSQPVGTYCLDLRQLLADGYIRYEPVGSTGSKVRVRIVRNADGRFHVQSRLAAPAFELQS